MSRQGGVAEAVRRLAQPLVHVSHLDQAMGGRLGIHVAAPPEGEPAAEVLARLVARRIRSWAQLLSRFDTSSQLTAVNDDRRTLVPLRPTIAEMIEWAAEASWLTGGIVDITLLDERLAAEEATPGNAGGADGGDTVAGGDAPGGPQDPGDTEHGFARTRRRSAPRWRLEDMGHRLPGSAMARSTMLLRRPGVRFDLDGVAKGWIADRALGLLRGAAGALVDADGDLSIRVAPGDSWEISVEDPRDRSMDLAVFRLEAPRPGIPARFGLATSGVTVHRWGRDEEARHHLIDPRTGQPASTDVVQATVLAGTAREAEAFAKTAVILGTAAGLAYLDRIGALGAVVLTTRGESFALPQTSLWLAA